MSGYLGNSLPLTGGTLTGGLTVALGTITADQQNFSGTATWNNAGVTFTALKLNVTATASAAASLLMDLQVAASSKFAIGKDGNFYLPDAVGLNWGTASSAPDSIFKESGASQITVYTGSTRALTVKTTGATLISSGVYGISASGPNNAADTGLSRISAGLFGIGTGAAASTAGSLSLTNLTAAGTTSLSGNQVSVATSTVNYGGLTTGLVNVMAAACSPAITAYTTGCFYIAMANLANTTTTPTITFNGVGAKTIVKRQATALAAGDYLANMLCFFLYDGTNMVLLNPVVN